MISSFTYQSPKTVADAVALLGGEWGKVEVLAGGSDLLALMKDRLATPSVVVNVKNLPELAGIEVANGSIRIGANVTLTQLSEHSAVRKHLPALAKSAGELGATQIRNVATVGGNLCQRRRDWYFRNGLTVDVPENLQYGAIFPMDNQHYVHPSTLAPVLIAYGASVNVAGPKGQRTVPVEKLFQVANAEKREVTLAPNELILNVVVPVANTSSSAIEIRERLSHDWPLVQSAAALVMEGDAVKKANVVLGHVAPVPMRAVDVEAFLAGKTLDEKVAAEAGKIAAKNAKPSPTNEYKVRLVEVAVKRALLGAAGNEYWRASS